MAHYDIFRGQLAIKYPAYGHALWKPSPPRLYSPVEIGDVGFIREGRYHRLFNALLSADHPSHKFGVPEYHEPLIPKLSDHIIYGTLSPSHYYSAGIDVVAAETDVRSFGPDDYPQASFFCKSRRGGAVLSLPVPAQRQDTLARDAFGKWMVTHIDRWFDFARRLELGIQQMEELILVTGCDRARSWTNVAFLKNQSDAQVSFGVDVSHGLEGRISWQFSPDRILGAVINQGPSGKSLPENQCIFIRGFRVSRTLGILPKHLRAAAQPPSDADEDENDQDPEPDVELISIPPGSEVKYAVYGDISSPYLIPQKYRDPLQLIFDYVAKGAPECDMVLVHDDDLARISGICDSNALETLPPVVAENYLQSSNAEIRTDLCYLLPTTNADRADTQIVRVAKLLMTSYDQMKSSLVTDLAPQTSLASENVDPHHISEGLAMYRRSLQGDKDNPLVSPNNTPHWQGPRPISLLYIPPELVTRILLYLSPHDIISCRRTCRMFHELCSYPHLRYLVQMERCAVSDEMRSGLGYSERLRILENREEAWATLDFRRSVQVAVPFHATSTYDLTGGAFLLGTRPFCADHLSTVGYSYLSLPSLSEDKKVEWKGFNLGIPILDVGLAVHEHDLIAVLTAKLDVGQPSNNPTTLEMRLLSFSTGQPHPLAEQPIIFIMSMSPLLGHCNVLIEVVGEFLALLITFPAARDEVKFFLVRWKRGETHSMSLPELRLDPQSSEWGAHSSFAFLLQDILVFPDTTQNVLRIAKIVIDDDDTPRLVPLCVLHLPPLNRPASIFHLGCRTEPNPTGSCPSASPAPSDRPFRDKAEDAIIMFIVYIDLHVRGMVPFTFVVHRCALLGHIPAAHRVCVPFFSTPEPTPLLVHVPWSSWGPTATRWFLGNDKSMAWIKRTAGQRTVSLEDSTSTPIIVRDFNPYAVRATRAQVDASGMLQEEGNWSMQLPNGNGKTLKVEDSVFTAGPIFKEDVRSSLPYVETVTRRRYRYDGVMMDDERILGLESIPEDAGGTWSIDVHVLG